MKDVNNGMNEFLVALGRTQVSRIPGTNSWWKKKAKGCDRQKHLVLCMSYS